MNKKKEWICLIIGFFGAILGLYGVVSFNQFVLMSLPLWLRMISMIIAYWLIALIPIIVMFVNKDKFVDYGFSKDRMKFQIIVGVLIGIAMTVILTLIPHILGIGIIPLPYLCKLSDYFNFSIDYILGITNNRGNKYLIKGFNIKTLGTNLKEIRLKNQLSQENIADILNVKQPCIYKYEKGLICISTSNLYKFSREFKISMNELCGKGKIKK